MSRVSHWLALVLLCGASGTVSAQTTDGYSSLQVVPIVVDSSSFVQRFNFHNPSDQPIEIVPEYYPGTGTSAVHITCPTIIIPGRDERVFTSLRALCPALSPGAQFGLLYLRHPGPETWSVFTRVSNPQGVGFAVEGFAASAFTSAITQVTGVRRLAATANSPAYQTNCFVANLPVYSGTVPTRTVHVGMYVSDKLGGQIGFESVEVAQGALVRLIDVFAAAGAPAGDYDDAMVEFYGSDGYNPGVVSFCTVQDNTSFGADFRIAKMRLASSTAGYEAGGFGAQDEHAARQLWMDKDRLGRSFVIPAGAFNNVHILPVRLPDFGRCELFDSWHGRTMTPEDGLELRIMNGAGETLYGGNNSVVVPDLPDDRTGSAYFGDKDLAPSNATWFVQVESNGQNTSVDRPYTLRCQSGSGMGLPNLVKYQVPGTEF